MIFEMTLDRNEERAIDDSSKTSRLGKQADEMWNTILEADMDKADEAEEQLLEAEIVNEHVCDAYGCTVLTKLRTFQCLVCGLDVHKKCGVVVRTGVYCSEDCCATDMDNFGRTCAICSEILPMTATARACAT